MFRVQVCPMSIAVEQLLWISVTRVSAQAVLLAEETTGEGNPMQLLNSVNRC